MSCNVFFINKSSNLLIPLIALGLLTSACQPEPTTCEAKFEVVEIAKFNSQINTITVSDDTVWIGSWIRGAARIEGQAIDIYNEGNSGIGDFWITSVAVENESSIWLGTYFTGLSHFDGEKWAVYTTENSGLPSNSVRALARGRDGVLWVGTHKGLATLSPHGIWETIQIGEILSEESHVLAIFVDSSDQVWVSTTSFGLFRYDGSMWHQHDFKETILSDDNIFSIAEGQDQVLWFATSGGLARLSDGKYNVYPFFSPVSSVAIGDNGRVWAATQGEGLAYFDDGNWTRLTTENSSLADNYINSINVDGEDRLWIGTHTNGIQTLSNASCSR